jgi:hypothetical protein
MKVVRYAEAQERRPRVENGVDFGAARIVLARTSDGRALVWTKAHRRWMNLIFGYQPQPGQLELIRLGDLFGETLHDSGGRLSRALFELHADKIDHYLGAPVADMLDARRTVLVDLGAP